MMTHPHALRNSFIGVYMEENTAVIIVWRMVWRGSWLERTEVCRTVV